METTALKKPSPSFEAHTIRGDDGKHTIRDDYATLLAQGPDTIKETFNIAFRPEQWERLERLKEEAIDCDPRGKGLVSFEIAGQSFQMKSHGRRGGSFCFENDDMEFQIRSKDIQWQITVEYRSAGLWEFTPDVLREKAIAVVEVLGGHEQDWIRLSEIHWAFDFYSPEFSNEISAALRENFVCVSKVKKKVDGKMPVFPAYLMTDEHWQDYGAGERTETVTVGSKTSLQVQIYDKGREIRENSGKFWMRELYQYNQSKPDAEGLVIDNLDDIWRVELRFKGKGYLKRRNIQSYEDFMDKKDAIIKDALSTRRLAQPTNDTNRSRWPNHHLWDACYMALEITYEPVPIGHYVTGKRNELLDNLKRNIAGSLRSAVVLNLDGEFSEDTLDELVKDAVAILRSDQEHGRKVDRAAERYRYVSEAQ